MSYPRPDNPTLRGGFERLLAPGFGYCFRCGRPWNFTSGHTTEYGEGRGCFPLCEKCWSGLDPSTRVPYYDRLVNLWIEQARDASEVEEHEAHRSLIREAVLAGG